ncbi:NADH:ubiquinone oxidoreductase, 17.2kDa subunit [Cordyceps fumosorosea ARSEF 2679]|uniref:NADH:ubiquinone oxidoreductase, 17.2kDa subunit n=1 Tax=Cordyceps fumosorosea (strain ARSEF 2679) TaxID=1081104 RepID=A0A167W0M8_CORFA|nr:NADH:ubiquinone oxidoreductase, 17.2kDa subunit [Cordyceps fumosorosea ARSEF 2679]OAA63187.1 NADH:ubiquinone oxidoreductase, 17.2kDa subunit [Cordyceps fumosorosea ARSEF 2679]
MRPCDDRCVLLGNLYHLPNRAWPLKPIIYQRDRGEILHQPTAYHSPHQTAPLILGSHGGQDHRPHRPSLAPVEIVAPALAQALPRRYATLPPAEETPPDLEGNTYWEFRLTTRGTREATPNALGEVERWRRIVHYPRSAHLSSVRVGPLWHQWLRYARADPPSLEEQREDVARQARTRVLAADADARWAAKPRVMEDPLPGEERSLPGATTTTTTTSAQEAPEQTTLRAESKRRRRSARAGGAAQKEQQEEEEEEAAVDPQDPWKQARTRGPSEDWQPQAWSPNAKR